MFLLTATFTAYSVLWGTAEVTNPRDYICYLVNYLLPIHHGTLVSSMINNFLPSFVWLLNTDRLLSSKDFRYTWTTCMHWNNISTKLGMKISLKNTMKRHFIKNEVGSKTRVKELTAWGILRGLQNKYIIFISCYKMLKLTEAHYCYQKKNQKTELNIMM